jgi:hypothetical protein
MLGRLAAMALRDGFVMPLPLSPSFIRLVQGHKLRAGDLPRAGFTGGEIAALEIGVCRKIEEIAHKFSSGDYGDTEKEEEKEKALTSLEEMEFTQKYLHTNYRCSLGDYLEASGGCMMSVCPCDHRASMPSPPPPRPPSSAAISSLLRSLRAGGENASPFDLLVIFRCVVFVWFMTLVPH